MSDSKHDKTEQPTPKRKNKARQKGQVIKSNELRSALLILISAGALKWYGPRLVEAIAERLVLAFSTVTVVDVSAGAIPQLAAEWILWAGIWISPMFLIMTTAGIAIAAGTQGGLLWTMQPLAPNLSKLNPIEGAKKLFGMKVLFSLVRDILKITGIALICYFLIKSAIAVALGSAGTGLWDTLRFAGNRIVALLLQTSLVLLVLGIIDFAYQRREHIKDLKMSKREVKDEYKEAEGDPLVRGRMRSEQKEMARKRMMQAVPEADVVLTNPTHFAVALKYDADEMKAPTVVAKGQRLIAQKIKQIARDAGVPIVEDKPLARSLFRSTEVGQQIPAALYRAVAEVLSTIYRAGGRLGPMTSTS